VTACSTISRGLTDPGRHYLDPPAFVKSRINWMRDGKGYIDVNRRALNHLNAGGILVTCSCSHHVDLATFEDILLSASVRAAATFRILDVRGQGPDIRCFWPCRRLDISRSWQRRWCDTAAQSGRFHAGSRRVGRSLVEHFPDLRGKTVHAERLGEEYAGR